MTGLGIVVFGENPATYGHGMGTAYSYNNKKNRLQTAGSDSFSYDNEGQLASGYNASYTFDYEHRLVSVNEMQHFYDGKGNRLKAVRSGVTTYYIYDMSGNVLAEADGNKNITKLYIQGKGLLAMVTPSDQVYSYHFNAIGSTVAMTDQSQNIVNKYAYDSFGAVLNQVEAFPQPFKYVGQYGVMAEPNGFYYMRARYYDPNVGRFVSEDPIGFEGGTVNLYEYVGNNPVNFVDPLGLQAAGLLATGWGIALGEPTPAGEIIMTVITTGVVVYEYYSKESKTSGKERATDAPSWTDYYPKKPGESCSQYADRILSEKYGCGDGRAKKRGSGSEHSQIKKNCERSGR